MFGKLIGGAIKGVGFMIGCEAVKKVGEIIWDSSDE